MTDPIPLSRVIQVFVVFMGAGIVFLIVALLILRRGRNNLNYIFSGFFLCIFAGAVVNVVYVLLTTYVDEIIVVRLHLLTYGLFCVAQMFLLLFNLILLKSEQVITIKKQLIMLLGFIVLVVVYYFIPDGAHINESTFYRPQWNLTMFLYANIICIVLVFIPTIYTAILIYKKFETPELKRRWKFYFIGIIMVQIEHIGVGVMIFINNPELRAIWNIYDIIFLFSTYFLYYGVGKQLRVS